MRIPTKEDCLSILNLYQVPEHIVRHSLTVHKVALFLCQAMNRHGAKLNQALVEAGSLLHDIAKMDGVKSSRSHSRDGALLLVRLGYPEVAEIVRQHVVLDPWPPDGWVGEAAIVHYADKRVKHTQVVSLEERFLDLKERYGKSPEAMAWLEKVEGQSLALERCLFERLPFGPEKINSLAEDPKG